MSKKIVFLKGIILSIGVLVMLMGLVWLPQIAELSALQNPEISFLKMPALFGIYTTMIPFYFALFQAIWLLNIIGKNKGFSESALKSLFNIKIAAYAIIFLYISGATVLGVLKLLHPSVFIIVFILVMASLCVAVFSDILYELIDQANRIQSENDLTI